MQSLQLDAVWRGKETFRMQVLPVDVTELVKVTLAMLIPLIAVLGFTVRFAAKPLVEDCVGVQLTATLVTLV